MSESEVLQLVADIAESYRTGIDNWLEHFADPLVVAAPASTLAMEHGSARGFFDEIRSQLRDRGLDRTVVRSAHVSMLGDDLAFADASFDRLRSDGSVLEPFAAGYLCRRRNGRWLVVTLAPRAPS